MPTRGQTVTLENLGERTVRQARVPGRCAGWVKRGGHRIEPGDLYVETEPGDGAGSFAMDRCCLDCAGLLQEVR
jgi:hypothetical protein